jgi:hypothetical protein
MSSFATQVRKWLRAELAATTAITTLLSDGAASILASGQTAQEQGDELTIDQIGDPVGKEGKNTYNVIFRVTGYLTTGGLEGGTALHDAVVDALTWDAGDSKTWQVDPTAAPYEINIKRVAFTGGTPVEYAGTPEGDDVGRSGVTGSVQFVIQLNVQGMTREVPAPS